MHRNIAASLLFICLGVGVQAQESDQLEEVIVRADPPMRVLRADAAEAEKALYEVFNAVLAEPESEIECRRNRPTGSLVRSAPVCEPAYARILRSEATRRALRIGGFDMASVRAADDATPEISRRNSILVEKFVVAINENSEVRQAFVNYQQKQQALAVALEGRSWSRD